MKPVVTDILLFIVGVSFIGASIVMDRREVARLERVARDHGCTIAQRHTTATPTVPVRDAWQCQFMNPRN